MAKRMGRAMRVGSDAEARGQGADQGQVREIASVTMEAPPPRNWKKFHRAELADLAGENPCAEPRLGPGLAKASARSEELARLRAHGGQP